MDQVTLIKEVTLDGEIYYIVVEGKGQANYVGSDLDKVSEKWDAARHQVKSNFKNLKACLVHVNKNTDDIIDKVGDLTKVGQGATVEDAVKGARLWELLQNDLS